MTFLNQAACIDNRIINGGLIGHEGHVRNNQCIFCAAGHGFGMMQHILHGNCQRILITKADHTQRITDQNRVNASFINQLGCRIVVCREHGLFFTFFFRLLEC